MKGINKNKSIIHIGANKTGTTSFQMNLFSVFNNISYIGQHCKENDHIKDELINLINQDDYYFNDQLLKKKIIEMKRKKSGIFLYSDEDIISSNNLSRTAKRLKKLLPDAKIVLTLRNQYSCFESWYKSHGIRLKMVPKDFYGKYVKYNQWIDYCYKFRDYHTTPRQISPFMAMNYKKIIDIFSKYFKKKNIILLIYEDFKFDPDKISLQWSKIIGLDKNLIKYIIQNKKMFRVSSKSLMPKINNNNKKLIKSYFSASNRYISKKFNLNLKKYNYPV